MPWSCAASLLRAVGLLYNTWTETLNWIENWFCVTLRSGRIVTIIFTWNNHAVFIVQLAGRAPQKRESRPCWKRHTIRTRSIFSSRGYLTSPKGSPYVLYYLWRRMFLRRQVVVGPSVRLRPLLYSLLRGSSMKKYLRTSLLAQYEPTCRVTRRTILIRPIPTQFCRSKEFRSKAVILVLVKTTVQIPPNWEWFPSTASL